MSDLHSVRHVPASEQACGATKSKDEDTGFPLTTAGMTAKNDARRGRETSSPRKDCTVENVGNWLANLGKPGSFCGLDITLEEVKFIWQFMLEQIPWQPSLKYYFDDQKARIVSVYE